MKRYDIAILVGREALSMNVLFEETISSVSLFAKVQLRYNY